MSYQKLIISGNVVELFNYEKSPFDGKRRAQSCDICTDMDSDRYADTQNSQRLERRQDNAKRAQVAFGRLCASNFDTIEIPLFVTFTLYKKDHIYSISEGYACFNVFTKRLRRRFGTNFRYIAVPEFGKKNTQRLHFHALFWGLPVEQFKRERKDRLMAKIWGFGFVEVVVTNNDVKVGYYLAKYLSKSYKDVRLLNHSSYVCSRNIRRPVVHSSFVNLITYYELGLDVDKLPICTKTYDTIYLGQCEFKLYNLL